jgi:hypothetical protein
MSDDAIDVVLDSEDMPIDVASCAALGRLPVGADLAMIEFVGVFMQLVELLM